MSSQAVPCLRILGLRQNREVVFYACWEGKSLSCSFLLSFNAVGNGGGCGWGWEGAGCRDGCSLSERESSWVHLWSSQGREWSVGLCYQSDEPHPGKYIRSGPAGAEWSCFQVRSSARCSKSPCLWWVLGVFFLLLICHWAEIQMEHVIKRLAWNSRNDLSCLSFPSNPDLAHIWH